MTKERINPPSVFRSLDHGFSQGVVASGRRTLYVSGQTAWDANKQLVGGADLHAQARQALLNLRHVVEASGGTLGDVVSLRIYVVAYEAHKAEAVAGAFRELRHSGFHLGGRGGARGFWLSDRDRGHRGPRLTTGS